MVRAGIQVVKNASMTSTCPIQNEEKNRTNTRPVAKRDLADPESRYFFRDRLRPNCYIRRYFTRLKLGRWHRARGAAPLEFQLRILIVRDCDPSLASPVGMLCSTFASNNGLKGELFWNWPTNQAIHVRLPVCRFKKKRLGSEKIDQWKWKFGTLGTRLFAVYSVS